MTHRDRLARVDISIHALREEGDDCVMGMTVHSFKFLSTPSARRATATTRAASPRTRHFYPRPPRGGRPKKCRCRRRAGDISIHALREEGDQVWQGRIEDKDAFLSTPSARRATCLVPELLAPLGIFLSTPSARRATRTSGATARGTSTFLSTPSARRATRHIGIALQLQEISIHALREEGDNGATGIVDPKDNISIHALREEGDDAPSHRAQFQEDFYPRPPRGGRRGAGRCT